MKYRNICKDYQNPLIYLFFFYFYKIILNFEQIIFKYIINYLDCDMIIIKFTNKNVFIR